MPRSLQNYLEKNDAKELPNIRADLLCFEPNDQIYPQEKFWNAKLDQAD